MSSQENGKPKTPRIDLNEFVNLGFLQELNRQFLHPRGLALEVVYEEELDPVTGVTVENVKGFGGVWDYRSDPEGIALDDKFFDDVAFKKAANVAEEFEKHREAREALFGNAIQPLPG